MTQYEAVLTTRGQPLMSGCPCLVSMLTDPCPPPQLCLRGVDVEAKGGCITFMLTNQTVGGAKGGPWHILLSISPLSLSLLYKKTLWPNSCIGLH